MFYYVDFHADGGQACVPGRRRFNDPDEAEEFSLLMASEEGHTCKNDVRFYESERYLREYGIIAIDPMFPPSGSLAHFNECLNFTTNEPEDGE